jgi:UDP-N-acetylglucosamine 2-epimerase (non-hydrolysing)
MRAVLIAGARPNFMKVKPVLDALEQRGAQTTLVHTGHYDAGMSDVFFDELGIRAPDQSLDVGSGTHAEQTSRVMVAFEPLLDKLAADVVVVVGDVNSTMACTLVAAKAVIPVAHVEAGLRSRDWTMPEEVNRVVTDRLSRYLLAPSEDAMATIPCMYKRQASWASMPTLASASGYGYSWLRNVAGQPAGYLPIGESCASDGDAVTGSGG